jgi:hypothetical protein
MNKFAAASRHIFHDPVIQSVPEWMLRPLAQYNYYTTAYVPDRCADLLMWNREVYTKGLVTPYEDLNLSPGESCLAVHLDRRTLLENQLPSGSKYERFKAVWERFNYSLNCISAQITEIPENSRPKYLAGPTHHQLAMASRRAGFDVRPVPPDIISYFTRYTHWMLFQQGIREKRNWMARDKRIWLATMPAARLLERFPDPPGEPPWKLVES